MMHKERTLFSLFLSNLIFTVLQPGIVAGLLPMLLVRNLLNDTFTPHFGYHHYAGITVSLAGLVVMLVCIVSFAVKGRGTLSPLDPARRLIVSGLYKYSRNPMYVGVMLILWGEAIFFRSASLWIYSCIIFGAFNAFIIFYEEPRLSKDFGVQYGDYQRRVRRWL